MFAKYDAMILGRRAFCRLFLSFCVLLGAAWVAQAQQTFTVTKTADTNDNACDADCSLREAILAANSNPGADIIAFKIGSGPATITPLTALPTINQSVVLDGTTQPGFAGQPIIEISGVSAPANSWGLSVGGDHVTVRGLVINRFKTGFGISVGGNGHHTIAGNFVGIDLTGTIAQGNFTGVSVTSPDNLIGGTTAADRNIIAGNASNSGLAMGGSASTNNVAIGNYIGTDVTGTIAIGNNVGVYLVQASSANTIGGSAPGSANLISGNFQGGIIIATNLNKIQGNLIGTKADGVTKLANTYAGIQVVDGHDNLIGGTGVGEGNFIYGNGFGNGGYGVRIDKGANNEHNAILGNSIYANDGLGIDLGGDGFTANDPDTGISSPQTANANQNYPVLAAVTPNGNNTDITGTLNSIPNTQFRLEFFSNPFADPTGFGEGKTFLGFLNVTTDANGNSPTFTFTVPSAAVVGNYITATATDPLNNTSEFSSAKPNAAIGTLQFSSATFSVNENGGTATITVTRTGGTLGPVSCQYTTAVGGTATAGSDFGSTSGLLGWADNQGGSKTFTITITDDTIDEPDETVSLAISNPTGGATLGLSSAVLTIVDNDPAPAISVNDVSKAEGNNGTTNFLFGISLSNPSSQAVTVNYATADVSAQAGTDYQAANSQATFNPGETLKLVTILVNGDMQSEGNETFAVNLTSPVNATLGKGQGIGTIVNDDGVAPPTIQFSNTTYSAAEDLGAITITVTRTGDSSAAASIDYTTADATATQKADFEYAAGTLSFAPGENSKTFQVLLNEDTYIEGNETFNVTLSNASGATVGQPGSATVTISDDSPETLTNPIDSAQSFVYTHYHDFLNREPDAAGLAFWTSQITSCLNDGPCIETKRNNVSASFFLSIEFQETAYLLYLMQKESFVSSPKYASFMRDWQEVSRGVIVNTPGWQQLLRDNQKQFAAKWVSRPGFKAFFDPLSNNAFVNALYANAGVVPEQAERDALIAGLNSASLTRADVVLSVASNPAFRQQQQSSAFVLMQYFGYLRRNPDASPDVDMSGYNFWLNKLNQFGGNYEQAEMVKAFLTSFEYRQRFGQ